MAVALTGPTTTVSPFRLDRVPGAEATCRQTRHLSFVVICPRVHNLLALPLGGALGMASFYAALSRCSPLPTGTGVRGRGGPWAAAWAHSCLCRAVPGHRTQIQSVSLSSSPPPVATPHRRRHK